MQVGIAYAEPDAQFWITVDVPDDCTVETAIRQSGLLERYPHIDLAKQKVGIFGKLAKLDAALKDGDRVEVYRPITADPKKVKRRAQKEDDPA